MKIKILNIVMILLISSCLPEAPEQCADGSTNIKGCNIILDEENDPLNSSEEEVFCKPNAEIKINCAEEKEFALYAFEKRICNKDGSDYDSVETCRIETCLEGFTRVENKCEKQVCIPGEEIENDCDRENATVAKTKQICSLDGLSSSGDGICEIRVCNSGFFLNDDVCMENVCVPNQISQMDCSLPNAKIASKSVTCNTSGTGVASEGQCTIQECDTGYNLIDGVCQQQQQVYLCSIGETQIISCVDQIPNALAASMTNTCSANRQGFDLGVCLLDSCQSGFSKVGSTCVADIVATPGEISFQDVTASALTGECFSTNSFGINMVDLNFDGYLDKVSFSHNHLTGGKHCVFLNQGNGTFAYSAQTTDDLTSPSSGDNNTCTWSAQISDFDGDGKADIWCRGSEAGSDFYRNITANIGDTPRFEHVRAWLGDNGDSAQGGYKDAFIFSDFNGDGSLERVNAKDGNLKVIDTNQIVHSFGVDVDWVDFNNDTWPDAWSNSGKIFRNDQGGGFTEMPFDSDLNECHTMRGIYHHDFDHDGDIDIICIAPNPSSKKDMFFVRNDGNFQFSLIEVSIADIFYNNEALNDYRSVNFTKGVVGLNDFDNDGYLDLAFLDLSNKFRFYQQSSLAIFTAKSSNSLNVSSGGRSRPQVAVGDYDLDGKIDLLLHTLAAGTKQSTSDIVRNSGSYTNNFIKIYLNGNDMGSGKNIEGIGARIVVKDTVTKTIVNSVYVSPSWKRSNPNHQNHIGLGTSNKVDIEIFWPSGFEKSQVFSNLDVNKNYKIIYNQGADDTIGIWNPGSGY